MLFQWIIALAVVAGVAGILGLCDLSSVVIKVARYLVMFLLVGMLIFFLANYLYENVLR